MNDSFMPRRIWVDSDLTSVWQYDDVPPPEFGTCHRYVIASSVEADRQRDRETRESFVQLVDDIIYLAPHHDIRGVYPAELKRLRAYLRSQP